MVKFIDSDKCRYFLFYIRKNFFNVSNFKFMINSIKNLVIDIFQTGDFLNRFTRRKNGISVLIPTQNEEVIVKLSIISFLDFADEIIVVDNGSEDNTKKIVKDLAKSYKKIKFFDKADIQDLYQNRQFALKKSQYRWICRFDSDYVAYTSGKNNILKLRKLLLRTPQKLIPKAFLLSRVNVDGDFWHVRTLDIFLNKCDVISKPEIRIYEYFPFFVFSRFGRREYVAFQNLFNKFKLKTVFWMHSNIKSGLNYFLRSERTNWRKIGNYKKYPTLISYIKDIIKEKYHTNNFQEAKRKYLKTIIYNPEYYIGYDEDKFLPYPSLIKEEMEKKNVFKLDNFQ